MLRTLAAAALPLLALAAQPVQARTLDEIIKSGEIRMGINVKIPPRGQLNEKNEPVGFEVDVVKELARRLGVKLTIVPVDSNERIPSVVTNRVDGVLGSMTRNSERVKVIDFTVPLSADTYGVISKKDSHLTKMSELNQPNITIVMTRGTAVLPFVQALAPKAQILQLDTIPDRNRAFVQGRGQAIVDIIDTALIAIAKPNNIELNVTSAPELRHTYSCIGVAKGNDSLRLWLNQALYEMHNEGLVKAYWRQWFGRDMDNYPRYTEFY
jgi:polar amino acid transport system substrate-binding protein